MTTAAKAAHDLGIPVHLDGARLANASVALDQSLDAFTTEIDTVMFDLSKGLGAPVGAVLAGPKEIIEVTRKYRFVFGGGMRQAGIIAAPGIVSLDNIDRLAIDHENAALLAEELNDRTDLAVKPPETNIVLIDTAPAGLTATEFLETCESTGVLGGDIDAHTVRFCTHLDVTREDIVTAADQISSALGG
jgi:threonine aldolase